MENRKITVEEVIKEDERHLLYSIKDDKAELLKVVQKAIKDLQKLEDDLIKFYHSSYKNGNRLQLKNQILYMNPFAIRDHQKVHPIVCLY